MAYKITDKCISCGACAAECPVGCISQGDDKFVIDESACISCGTCEGVCPVEAPVESNDKILYGKTLDIQGVIQKRLQKSNLFNFSI